MPPQHERTIELKSVISPSSFAHIVIRTNRFDEMVRWYQIVLGANLVFRDSLVCFLTYDHEHHRIALLSTGQSHFDNKRSSIDHFAYTYRNLGELLSTYYRLLAEGISPVRTINHGPTISFYYRDPEGLKLELQVDNFDSLEESHAFFKGPEFASNPIGVLINPDQLRQDWEAGVPWAQIRTRPPLPAGKTPKDMQVERATGESSL